MLRAAVAAGTPVGLRAKEIMERGDLVSDEVVVGIVADRIEEPDAKAGFILDGFPRTVAQAEALERMLDEKGLKLDAVIEFVVDEAALVDRIVVRAKQAEAAGQPVRKDDNPEVFKTRLDAYRVQTAPALRPLPRQGDFEVRRRHGADRRRHPRAVRAPGGVSVGAGGEGRRMRPLPPSAAASITTTKVSLFGCAPGGAGPDKRPGSGLKTSVNKKVGGFVMNMHVGCAAAELPDIAGRRGRSPRPSPRPLSAWTPGASASPSGPTAPGR
jgi:adenylate kinase